MAGEFQKLIIIALVVYGKTELMKRMSCDMMI